MEHRLSSNLRVLCPPYERFLRRQDMLRRTIINNNKNGSCSILSVVRPLVLLRLAIVVSVRLRLMDSDYTFGIFKIFS